MIREVMTANKAVAEAARLAKRKTIKAEDIKFAVNELDL